MVALAVAMPQGQPPAEAAANFQPIGNGFVGGVNIPTSTANTATNPPNVINGGANGASLAGGLNNPLTSGGGTAFGPGAVASNAGLVGTPGAVLPNQLDLAGNGLQGNRIGAAGIAGYLPPGRTQVLPNQRFNINTRMLVQVSEGELLCDAGPGGNAGFAGLPGGQQGQEFLLRSGQTFRFRGLSGQGKGIGGGGLNQGFATEACIAQRPSIVLAEPY
ncbi:protein of unknown function [Taphrina deformans PYCC 5710]|uniref:Uncharacterized protein n=1 Tax=Taphrina deformans (strain PYCC 5710 / ATCC 11124 / CBS 356.35 / IMI 108563 / JCM 9778 / NBRC 8474) TaxID=1097556 RepID=R4XGG4_TAPDE|nr:protein of unknown function [Taphrina deformans PYCC 5710]|eukprot:CCG83574.1 protein of unknown function [Taphrina deformans PYCC 5710]